MTASVAVGVTIIALICAFARLDHGVAQNIPKGEVANERICGSEQFQCKNTKCIQSELLCDGRPDCTDNSDEEQAECSKPELQCPDYTFRCAYGACVDGDAKCNGVKDCFDNSDEDLAQCSGVGTSNKIDNGDCPDSQRKCNNGQCIDETSFCDGTADCEDMSDETFEACGSFSCPQLVFRCNYGGCIDGDKKCDRKRDCADGSDEDPALCGGPTIINTTEVTTTERTIVQPTEPRPPPSTSGCPGPAQPRNGQWRVHSSLCPSGEDCISPEGVNLEPGTPLVYSCKSGYKLRGSTYVFCGREGKWSPKPVCIEITCPPLVHPSFVVDSCTYLTQFSNCGAPVLPGTSARLSCANSYQKDSPDISRSDNIVCQDDGLWDPKPIHCKPVCGITSGFVTPTATNGQNANITEFPWHATLYRQETKNGPKEFKCGATIIQPNLLVTAAHCVYDEVQHVVQPATSFHVATGNQIQGFDSNFHDPRFVRKRQVKNVYINCKYRGLIGNYALDIALLELIEPFELSTLLRPICMDFVGFDDNAVLESGAVGRVAGFGRTTTGPSSFILQTVTVPFVSYSECLTSSERSSTTQFITEDKFCGGYGNGTSVCDGDSGGGVVFKTAELWYLRGIVSVGLGVSTGTGSRTCDSFSYALFTRVSRHLTWINNVMRHIQNNQPFVPCSKVSNQ